MSRDFCVALARDATGLSAVVFPDNSHFLFLTLYIMEEKGLSFFMQ